MRKNRSLREALEEYLPKDCAEPVLTWFGKNHVLLVIARSRSSKLGDFRSRGSMAPPVISINHDLNSYSFLVTLLHEMAHAEVLFTHKKRVQPHGQEWKTAYRKLALPYLGTAGLDPIFVGVFGQYLQNPSASSGANQPLAKVLRSFDQPREVVLITDIAKDTFFAMPNGRIFRKGAQLRKRIRCECLNNKRIYLFSPMAEIKPISDVGFIS
jgi:hypothetical protein